MDPGPAGADGERCGRGRCGALRGRRQAVRGLLPGRCRQGCPSGGAGARLGRAQRLRDQAGRDAGGPGLQCLCRRFVRCRGQAEHGGRQEAPHRGPLSGQDQDAHPAARGIGGGGQAGGAARQCGGPRLLLRRRRRAGAGPQRGGSQGGGERTRRAGDPGRAGLQRGEGRVACPARQRRRGGLSGSVCGAGGRAGERRGEARGGQLQRRSPRVQRLWLGQLPRRCRCQVLAAFHRFPEGGDRLLRGPAHAGHGSAMAFFMPVFRQLRGGRAPSPTWPPCPPRSVGPG